MGTSRIAAQLYTLRDFTHTAKDFESTARRVRDIGYEAVQVSAVGALDSGELSAAEVRAVLDANGLACIATHRPFEVLARDTDAEIALHTALGCNFAVIPILPLDYLRDGADGYERFCDDAQPVIDRLLHAGIRFGVHNHAHEFERVRGGRTLYSLLIDRGGSDMLFEVDVYWAAHAGVNPAKLLTELRGTVPVIHAKDREVVAKEGPVFAPVGEGNLDWDGIIAAGESSGVEWYAVEQDVCRRDPFDCLRSSLQFLTARGL